MQNTINWAISLLLLVVAIGTAQAAIPANAVADPKYRLGYLVCTHYPNVVADNVTDAFPNLQVCLQDAWANSLTAFLPCPANPADAYMISDGLRGYEWQPLVSGATQAPHPANYMVTGSQAGGCQPTIKILGSSTNFNSTTSPRAMLAFRNFLTNVNNAACDTGTGNPLPSPPFARPTEFCEGSGNMFSIVVRNIHLHTNGKAGAVGLAMIAAQQSGIYDVKVTASNGAAHSLAGLYGLPGRNSVTANVEVVGGQHCVGQGSVWGLAPALDNTSGPHISGLTCTNQTDTVLEMNDTVPITITGLAVTKSSAGGSVIYAKSPLVVVDAAVTLSGAAVGNIVFNNVEGFTVYARNISATGSTYLIHSAGTPYHAQAGTWARIQEYAYGDAYNKDGSNDPTVYPTNYPTGATRFETRNVMNGSLTGGGLAVLDLVSGPQTPAPPADILSRHVWAGKLPSFEDGPYTEPTGRQGCQPTPIAAGFGTDGTDGNSGADCRLGIQDAIDAARTAGHNRVVLAKGVFAVGACPTTTGCITLHKDTKLMGAGQGMNSMIAYHNNWNPTSETYFVTTDNEATSTAYMGFFAFFARSSPFTSQFTSYWHWRLGAGSLTAGLGYEKQFVAPGVDSQPLKLMKYSGNGGGKHYGNHYHYEQNDSHAGVRVTLVENTSQPLSLYGQNGEITKTSSPLSDVSKYANANTEITGAQNVRWYGCKREGRSPTALIHNSSNIAIYGCGAMSLPVHVPKGGYLQVTGTSNNVLIAVQQVRDSATGSNGEVMLREALSPAPSPPNGGNVSTWPNGVALYKRGTINDAPFQSGAAPPPTAPTLLGIEIVAADQINVQWNIFDAAALIPSSAVSGLTVTVDGVPVTIVSSVLQPPDLYWVGLSPGTLVSPTQVVQVKYDPGNILSGATSQPAVAFPFTTADNNIPPTPQPVLSQDLFAFRSIYGGFTDETSPWYRDAGSSYENVAARFIPGARFRLPITIKNTVADAGTRSFTVCYRKNQSGAYALLPETCTASETCFTEAPDLADGLPVPPVLTPGGGTYIEGGVLEHANTQTLVTLPVNSETTYDPAIHIAAAVSIGSQFEYQLCGSGGTPLTRYVQTPLVTVVHQRSRAGGGVRR